MLSVDDAISEIAEGWRRVGIASGDTVLIHSNIKRTLVTMRRRGVKLTPEHVLKSFLEAVGNEGTLLLPLFNFDFPNTKLFDIRNTPSQMGALTKLGRLHPEATRTGHPIYSFAIIWKHAPMFKNVNNISGYGEDSPFAMLRELNGKIGSLDLEDQNSMTFYHHVEEMHKVPYRYFKNFEGIYIDAKGIASERTYKLFVRDTERSVLTHVNPAGEMMWNAGIYTGERPLEKSGLRVVKANEMYNFVSSLIEQDRALGTLYRIGED